MAKKGHRLGLLVAACGHYASRARAEGNYNRTRDVPVPLENGLQAPFVGGVLHGSFVLEGGDEPSTLS